MNRIMNAKSRNRRRSGPTQHANRKALKFGIVTPVLNARATFKACAASVQAHCAEIPGAHFVRESASSAVPCEDIAAAFGCDYRRAADAGMYDALGRGLDDAVAAGCDILGWLNADEQHLPGAFRAVRAAFDADPALDIVFGDYLILGADAAVLAARREIPARRLYLRQGVNYLLSCTVFFRSALWIRLGGFDSPTQRFVGVRLPDLFSARLKIRLSPHPVISDIPLAATANRQALMIAGTDLFSQRKKLAEIIRQSVLREPHILWQFVLEPTDEEPLDLLEHLIDVFKKMPDHWLDRLVSIPGTHQFSARRLFVKIPRGNQFDPSWIEEAEACLAEHFH